MQEQRTSVAVIVPAYNAEATLGACLRAINTSERLPQEVIVVDDGSTDQTAAIARSLGARVLSSGQRAGGPGRGRNLAAAVVEADVVVFIDSDVVVEPDAIGRLVAPIQQPKRGEAAGAEADKAPVVATFGSYTARSPVSHVAGRYANLRHHDVHQRGGAGADRQATTFWSGLGAAQRDALLKAGGFASRYGRPSIEDIELGGRLVAAGGAIRIVPAAQGTHLKNWSVGELWRTDVLQRAIPWAQVAVEQGKLPSTLNADWRGRVSAAALGGGLAALALAGLLGLVSAWAPAGGWGAGAALALVVGLAGIGMWVMCEWSLLRLLAQHGARTLIGGAILHACYTIYAPATVLGTMLWGRWAMRGRKVRRA